jgi:hypothetical protein
MATGMSLYQELKGVLQQSTHISENMFCGLYDAHLLLIKTYGSRDTRMGYRLDDQEFEYR